MGRGVLLPPLLPLLVLSVFVVVRVDGQCVGGVPRAVVGMVCTTIVKRLVTLVSPHKVAESFVSPFRKNDRRPGSVDTLSTEPVCFPFLSSQTAHLLMDPSGLSAPRSTHPTTCRPHHLLHFGRWKPSACSCCRVAYLMHPPTFTGAAPPPPPPATSPVTLLTNHRWLLPLSFPHTPSFLAVGTAVKVKSIASFFAPKVPKLPKAAGAASPTSPRENGACAYLCFEEKGGGGGVMVWAPFFPGTICSACALIRSTLCLQPHL
jgi:hypothetical protein